MLHLSTVHGHERMSTRELLLRIRSAVEAGETEFSIAASGQHDIGGPLWNARGETLRFEIENPGQRVGSMALPGTEILVRGSAPADVGWLNAGGHITVLGDAGDTTGHCAAAGKIHVGGRAGARTGSLMKHDPLHEPPELWVLGGVGSFAFEFMGGGRAVVCGHDCAASLGERPCVGMVGGVVYVRGACPELPPEVRLLPLDAGDREWLDGGMAEFLGAIGRPELLEALGHWEEWRKIVPVPRAGDAEAARGTQAGRPGVREFHARAWPEGGLFGDVLPDDGGVAELAASGAGRLRAPLRNPEAGACRRCWRCVRVCPRTALQRRGGAARGGDRDASEAGDGAGFPLSVAERRCIGCGLCAAVCPEGIWRLTPVELP
ncbi:4Fe-4S dicluster domain-containing protein [uncultured Desulfovibrio sp.]|uniref:GltB/FmdC/FwdC-like GXGXG domain-containing protein n=1 Tax=uncultured Desulfovibrio sp. TaxID=167968 RepID=UPI0028040116|nr:4Fe-4S dicluster domain-containing protein [uncultured Desulfovibrio sp.]